MFKINSYNYNLDFFSLQKDEKFFFCINLKNNMQMYYLKKNTLLKINNDHKKNSITRLFLKNIELKFICHKKTASFHTYLKRSKKKLLLNGISFRFDISKDKLYLAILTDKSHSFLYRLPKFFNYKIVDVKHKTLTLSCFNKIYLNIH